jgi:hypothetical protein
MNEYGRGGEHLAGDGAELALGVLTGRERARAIEHLQQCGQCRARVHRMTLTSDDLLDLLPGQQPPPGFSAGVTDRLRRARKTSRRPRPSRLLAAAAALVLVAAAGLAGWGLRAVPRSPGSAGTSAQGALRKAMLITPTRQDAGSVYLHRGSPTWMFTAIDLDRADQTVICQLIDQAGRVITVGSFRLVAGDGYWGSPEPDQATAITSARLITTSGTLLASGTFPRGR